VRTPTRDPCPPALRPGAARCSLLSVQLPRCRSSHPKCAFSICCHSNAPGRLCASTPRPCSLLPGCCSRRCCSHTCTPVSSVSSYADVTPNSEAALLAAIAQQPVSVSLEADQSSFQFYSEGVMTGACGTNLDHGVLAVGYGTDAGTPYYKVRRRCASRIMLPFQVCRMGFSAPESLLRVMPSAHCLKHCCLAARPSPFLATLCRSRTAGWVPGEMLGCPGLRSDANPERTC
jgi:hypothetical protein